MQVSPFDPQPTQEWKDPADWFMQHRLGGPDLGSLLLLQPERAAEVLAQQGIPPPPLGGRTGGAAIPTQGPGPSAEAQERPTPRSGQAPYPTPTPQQKVEDRFPQAGTPPAIPKITVTPNAATNARRFM